MSRASEKAGTAPVNARATSLDTKGEPRSVPSSHGEISLSVCVASRNHGFVPSANWSYHSTLTHLKRLWLPQPRLTHSGCGAMAYTRPSCHSPCTPSACVAKSMRICDPGQSSEFRG
jgi:hypothetical protein